MLYRQVEAICATIDQLPNLPPQAFVQQIAAAAPETVEQLVSETRRQGRPLQRDDAVKAVSAVGFTLVKAIPRTARAMAEKSQDQRVHPARRCAIAGILAYLVQPRDIIPDDAPGYYGYLDDTILLHAGLIEYCDTLPQGYDQNFLVHIIGYGIGLLPALARPAVQLVVGSMSQVVQLFGMMGPEIALVTLAQIVANPLQASSAASAPAGFSPQPARDYQRGHWSGGAYFENGNVIMGGGGPALIDGQLFIPG
jgi:uncharacterized membrane protein YkvA (DUF1232 family)